MPYFLPPFVRRFLPFAEYLRLTRAARGYNAFMELKGKRVAILIDTVYQEIEVWYPFYRLQEAHVEVSYVAAEAGKTYNSKCGYPAKSALSYDQAKTRDYDGVVIPGGYAPDHIRRHPKAEELPAVCRRANKVLARGPVFPK